MLFIEQKGINELRLFLEDLDNLDMKELHSALGDTGVQIIEERFDKFVDPSGKRWKPLKHEYVRDGILRPVNNPLKFRTLYKSFSFDATERDVSIGTPVDYAKFHSDFPKNNQQPRRVMPLREFMGFVSQRDASRLQETTYDYIDTHTAGR
jgi:phage gpG-like protein